VPDQAGFDGLLVEAQAESGAFTDIYLDGNVGQAFLKPFRIVLDYRGDRIAFVERE